MKCSHPSEFCVNDAVTTREGFPVCREHAAPEKRPIDISRALKTPGMMAEEELFRLAKLSSEHQCIVEIGSWMGRSARAMADNTPGILFCVDTWADDAYGPAPAEVTGSTEWLWNAFKTNMGGELGKKVFPWRTSSLAAARIMDDERFSTIPDMIFIDAGHSYQECREDILAWRPVLKPGGILCGHDYWKDGPYHPGVKQAVDEFFPNVTVVGTIWSVEL